MCPDLALDADRGWVIGRAYDRRRGSRSVAGDAGAAAGGRDATHRLLERAFRGERDDERGPVEEDLHGPHHVMKEWADKYAGKFEDGWDAYRERVHGRAKELGWIPTDAELTPRHPDLPAWDDIPEAERPFQRCSRRARTPEEQLVIEPK